MGGRGGEPNYLLFQILAWNMAGTLGMQVAALSMGLILVNFSLMDGKE